MIGATLSLHIEFSKYAQTGGFLLCIQCYRYLVDIRQCDQNTKVIVDIVDIDRCITVLEMTVVMPGYLWVALSFGEEIAAP